MKEAIHLRSVGMNFGELYGANHPDLFDPAGLVTRPGAWKGIPPKNDPEGIQVSEL